MVSFNKVILMGNLVRDPELRYNPNGNAVANFTLALNRKYKQGEGDKEEVSYIDIVVWGKQAENCGQYLHKGNGAIVDGRLQQRRWEKDGQKHSKVEVVANSVQFMPKKQAGQEPESEEMIDEGDIPF